MTADIDGLMAEAERLIERLRAYAQAYDPLTPDGARAQEALMRESLDFLCRPKVAAPAAAGQGTQAHAHPAATPTERPYGRPSDETPVVDQAAPRLDEHAQLMKFYGVTTLAELVAKQAHHIEKLQAKLPPTPNVFAPQRVREG